MTKEQLLEVMKHKLAERGLPLLEDSILATIEVLDEVITTYLEQSESKVDDIAIPIVHSIAKALKVQSDKIDGQKELV